jgi:hypothetical protein
VCFSANATELFRLLPQSSAIAAGADFNALCSHRQGAILFDKYFAALTDAPLEKVFQACYGCDAHGRSRVALLRFNRPETVEHLLAGLAGKKEQNSDEPAYILRNSPDDRKFYRLYPLNSDTVGIYWRFPENGSFRPDSRGAGVQLRSCIPVRQGVMLWGVGFPNSENRYLKQITAFDFVLESDFNGDLLLHGKIVCRSAAGASAFVLFLNTVAGAVLQSRYGIPAQLTVAAVEALQIQREGKILRFSSRNVEPVIAMFSTAIRDMIPDYQMVLN